MKWPGSSWACCATSSHPRARRASSKAFYFGGDAMDIDADDGSSSRSALAPLPVLKVDTEDPAANTVLSFPAADPRKRAQYFELQMATIPNSMELKLRMADALIAVGASGAQMVPPAFERAGQCLDAAHTFYPYDWRIDWQRGRLLLAEGQRKVRAAGDIASNAHNRLKIIDAARADGSKDLQRAFEIFENVYTEIPGELCAKLGCAVSAEAIGNFKLAARLYDLVSKCDPSFSTASFGLARCLLHVGDRIGAARCIRAHSSQREQLHQSADGRRAHVDGRGKSRAVGRGFVERVGHDQRADRHRRGGSRIARDALLESGGVLGVRRVQAAAIGGNPGRGVARARLAPRRRTRTPRMRAFRKNAGREIGVDRQGQS